MTKSKANRGGPRDGAGRPTFYKFSLERHTVRIASNHRELLEEVSPNISQAIRTVLDDPETLTAIQKLIERNRANAT